MTECKLESLRDDCMKQELRLEVTRLLVDSELEIDDFIIKLWFYKNKDAIYSNRRNLDSRASQTQADRRISVDGFQLVSRYSYHLILVYHNFQL